MYSFSYLGPVCCSMSSSNCCFLTCKQISQEAGQVVWYSHLFQNFPKFIVIHTVKGFTGCQFRCGLVTTTSQISEILWPWFTSLLSDWPNRFAVSQTYWAKVSVAQSCATLCNPMDCNQDPLSMELSRQEYWSGLPFPSPYWVNYCSTLCTPSFFLDLTISL